MRFFGFAPRGPGPWRPNTLWGRIGGVSRLQPVSRVFGLDRGQSIARYYIEQFLRENSSHIHGWGDYWRLTDASVRSAFGNVFGAKNVTVTLYGNVLAACAYLQGLAAEELTVKELNYRDDDYQIVIGVRASRSDRTASRHNTAGKS